MIFSVNKTNLRNALSVASKALSKTIIQVERSHLLFSIHGTKLSVKGTNNDTKAAVDLELSENDHSEQYSFTADPKIMDKLVTKIELDLIVMEFDPKELTLKVYTTEDRKSFNTMQSFPLTKMLNVDGVDRPLDTEHTVTTEVFKKALVFCQNYLDMKEENKRYDFVIINKGVMFSSNGLNKMGFFVASEMKSISNFKIRKVVIPTLIYMLGKIDSDQIIIGEQDNNIIVRTPDKTIYFGFLKSAVESPKISLDMLKKEGPYTLVNRIELNKKLKRLYSTKTSIAGSGIELTLSGAGSNAKIDLALLANLKARESLDCERIDDDSPGDQQHIMDCNLFENAVSSFVGDTLNLYINTAAPFFRIYEVVKNEEKDYKYITVGVGSYSRIVKK